MTFRGCNRIAAITALTCVVNSAVIAGEPAQASPTWIEPGESIVVLESPQFVFNWEHQSQAARIDVKKCVSDALQKNHPQVRVVLQPEFVKLAFPDLPPEAAPISPESLKLLTRHDVLRQRIAPLDVRYLIYVGTVTEIRTLYDLFGCAAGMGAAICVTAAGWNQQSDYSSSIVDIKTLGELRATGSVEGRGWHLFITPFPLPLSPGRTSATENPACQKVGQGVLTALESQGVPPTIEQP